MLDPTISAMQSFDSDLYGSLTVFRDLQNREYFRAIDVCSALRHGNPSQAISRYVDEDYVIKVDDGTNRGGAVNYLSEPGLYQLIFASKTEVAKRFQKWVLEDVLPKLRASGSYSVPQPASVTEDIFGQIPSKVTPGNMEQSLLCLEYLDRTAELITSHASVLRGQLNAHFIKYGIDWYQTECGLVGKMVTRNSYDITDLSKVPPKYLITKTVTTTKHDSAKIKRDYDNGKTIAGVTIRPASRLNITRKEAAFNFHSNRRKLNGIER